MLTKRMKYIVSIGVTSSLIALLFGLWIQLDTSRRSHKIDELSDFLIENKEKYPAVGVISTNAIDQYSNYKTYNAKFILPRVFDYPKSDLKELLKLQKSCDLNGLSSYENRNNWTYDYANWLMYECKHGKYKPAKFSKLHPFGKSYAQRKLLSLNPRDQEDFVQAHLEDFHLNEIFAMEFTLPLDYEVAQIVGNDIWKQMAKKPQIVLLSKYILVPIATDKQKSPLFTVYDRIKYLTYLRDIRFRNGLSPFWSSNKFNSKSDYYLSWGLQSLSIVIIILLSLYLFITITMARQLKKRSVSEQKIVLQGLTHELRTPMTAIKLSIEPFRTHYMDLDPKLQRSFLNLSSSIEKCSQVIHSSHDFLRALNTNKSLICPIKIDSIAFYINENFPLEEGFRLMVIKDFTLNTDVYWLRICLSNLIENSFKHGTGTVTVSLDCSSRKKSISVSDEGNLTGVDIQEILTPFVSTDKQTGLGLGLTLVNSIIESLGAKLVIDTNPTTFTLEWVENYA